ncbi:MAG: HEPN domain-containing protein [Bryobacteraceae bacterium]
MTRRDFQQLAEDRVADAQTLFNARRFDAAYYLAGYSVECALKACIAKLSRRHHFPASPESIREIYTHDFNKLSKAAGLLEAFKQARLADNALDTSWGIVKDWSEKSRYDRNSGAGMTKAQSMIQAVADPGHGVLQCIKKYW